MACEGRTSRTSFYGIEHRARSRSPMLWQRAGPQRGVADGRAFISLQPYRGPAVVSTTSQSWVIVAVLAIIADAEQYFSTDSAMARSTFSGASPRPFTTKCM